MKKSFIILFLLLLSAICLPGEVLLIRNSRAAGRIYMAENALPGEKCAAEELQEYFKKSSGAQFALTENLSEAKIVPGTVDSAFIPENIRSLLKNRKPESFLLKTHSNKLYIVGASQVGTLYGAYTFLERFLSVRWFMPGEEYVEKKSDLLLSDLETLEEPDFLWRELSQTGAGGFARSSKIWAARNKLQSSSAFGIGALTDPAQRDFFAARIADHVHRTGGHLTFYNAVPPQKYLQSHPEYFALVNGKRLKNTQHNNTHHCISNLQVRKLLVNHICRLLEEHDGKLAFLFGAPDSVKDWCECANCRALDRNMYNDVSQRFHFIAQQAAQEVYKRKPDAQLLIWAYANYRTIPSVDIDPRMTVYFCTHGRCFAHTLEDPACPRNVKILTLIKKWLQKNPNMKLYEYAHCTPMNWTPLEKTLAADLKTYKKLKIKGWKEEISYPDANWRGKKPTLEEDARHNIHRLGSEWLYWLVAGKLTWNASLDVNALIADFESKYYGKSYKAMKKFNDLRRSAWDNASGCFGYPHGDARTQKALTKAGTAEKMLALLDEAEKLAGNDETLLRRIRRDREYFKQFWIKADTAYRALPEKELLAPQISSAVLIDGSDHDAAWLGANYIDKFKLVTPDGSRALPEALSTSAGMLSDRQNLYFLFIANEAALDRMKAQVKSGRSIAADDGFTVTLDPQNASRRCYRISVNTKGAVWSDAAPGVSAACRIDHAAKRYIIELKVPVKNIEGFFEPGVFWKVHFSRNRTVEDTLCRGEFSDNGRSFKEKGFYRTFCIGRSYIKNGNFAEYHTNGRNKGKLKYWILQDAAAVKSDEKTVIHLPRGGRINQLLWDWNGALGQSEKPKTIKIMLRASGQGKLKISALKYNDVYRAGKLKRTILKYDTLKEVTLTAKSSCCSMEYTIPADCWISLYVNKIDQGSAQLENISLALK